jgi:uncharacterized lipoprotein YddW (UPF0748 family)
LLLSCKSGIYKKMNNVLYTITLSILAFFISAMGQMRGVWVCSGELRTGTEVKACLDACAAMGLGDVFLQVRTAGDAAYASATEPPPHKMMEDDLDVLALACAHGHKLGLRVHAWLNINYCAPGPGLPVSPKHIANRHPDWIACGRDGTSMALMKKPDLRSQDSEGLYLSPDAEGICDYYQAVVGEILEKYTVDGIHLDFIRYANYRFDYGGKMTDEFTTKYSVDPAYITYEKGQCGNDRECDSMELWRRIMNLRWMQMRADALTGLVCAIRHAQVATRPDAVLSAAVWFPQPWAFSYVGQDWMSWLDEDIVDIAIPMAYSKNDEPLKSYLPKVKEYLQSGRMAIGLGAWRLDGAGNLHKLEMMDKYSAGWVLFDYGSLVDREKVAKDISHYVDEHYALSKSPQAMLPAGWQMGWANRRPLASTENTGLRLADDGQDLNADSDYENEAVLLSNLAAKAWGDRHLIPPENVLAERILPWVDKCNQSIALISQPREEDLRIYFNVHQSRYLPKTKKQSRRQKHTKEEIEVAYQKNRDKVYRDAMLEKINRVVDDVVKKGKISVTH